MTLTLSRRELLSAAAASAALMGCPSALSAATGQADWTLGVADVDADLPLRPLSRISGRLPKGLAGTLYRNGPAKFRRGTSASGHWFDGDGLVRAYTMRPDGTASFAARFVDTPKRRLETQLGKMVIPGFGTPARKGAVVTSADATNAANTSVLMSGGELLALWEAGSATAMDPISLETRGPKTFRPDLAQMPFLAHPRVEPDGRVWNLGLGGRSAIIWRIGADGRLESAETIRMPRASYLHDFTATARHLVIVLQPWIQDSAKLPFVDSLSWRPEQGTQILVIDKDDFSRQRIYELPSFAFFHMADAWEETDGTIRFDICTEANPSFGASAARALVQGVHEKSPRPILAMIALSPDGRATLQSSGVAAEFPRTDPRRAGLSRGLTAHVGSYRTDSPFAQSIGLWDWKAGREDTHAFEGDHLVEEFVMVPKAGGSRERDSWLVGTTLNLKARATELHVLDAARVSAGPVATFRADVPLPVSFHGIFAAA
jgi:all-trans-8'-apo-beta-carotenal 15,15'-oxygenase